MKRITVISFAFALSTALLATTAVAQTTAPAQDQALGDYARKIRKDPGIVKARPKVFDNDNLPADDKLSVVGQPNTANTASDKDAAGAKADADQARKQAEWKAWQDKLTTQKDQIGLASRELDVLQREYELRAAAMYADAGNQKAVDDAKQKLTDMQEGARKDGVPSSMIE